MSQFTGVDRLVRRLARTGPNTRKLVSDALLAAGRRIEEDAIRNSGLPKDSFETTRRGEGLVEVVAKAPYAADLEYGTATTAARPFLRPAALKMRSEVVQRITAAVRKGAQ